MHCALIAGALALFGCASSQANEQPTTARASEQQTSPPQAQPPQAQPPGMGHASMHGSPAMARGGMCPAAVEGTTVQAEDVEGGAAILFTTSGDLAELRRRVATMAEMRNRQQDDPGKTMGRPQAGARGGMRKMHGGMGRMHGGMMMPSATARSEEVEGGARLVLTPRDPAQLSALREQVRQRAEAMSAGQCPMMMSTPGADADTE